MNNIVALTHGEQEKVAKLLRREAWPTARAIRYLGADENAARYIGGKLGLVISPPFEVLGIFAWDALSPPHCAWLLLGGFVLNGRSGANVDLTVYGPGLMTRQVLSVVAFHVYERLRCERITARCRRSNRVARRFVVQAGFEYEGTQRRYFGPTKYDDAMIYGLLRSECRWLEYFHGRP